MSHDCTLLDVIVVGAGQAGLAVAQQLAARDDLRIVVLEAGAEIGEVWRGRWDSLTLFTPAEYCSLPGLAFPASPGTYPTKDQVADYLALYAAHFALPVPFNTRVRGLRLRDGVCVLDTTQGALSARQVVVATGPFQTRPRPPRTCTARHRRAGSGSPRRARRTPWPSPRPATSTTG